jgi:hypothetical protein
VGGARGAYRREQNANCIQGFGGRNLKERDHF